MFANVRAAAQAVTRRSCRLAGDGGHRHAPERVVIDPADGLDGRNLRVNEAQERKPRGGGGGGGGRW